MTKSYLLEFRPLGAVHREWEAALGVGEAGLVEDQAIRTQLINDLPELSRRAFFDCEKCIPNKTHTLSHPSHTPHHHP